MSNRITLTDVQDTLLAITRMSCKPDDAHFSFYKDDAIIDENQTVKWNRDEVARRNEIYSAEVKRLEKLYAEACCEGDKLAVAYIMQETAMNKKQAVLLWNYVYDEHHAWIADLIGKLRELISLHIAIQEAK